MRHMIIPGLTALVGLAFGVYVSDDWLIVAVLTWTGFGLGMLWETQ